MGKEKRLMGLSTHIHSSINGLRYGSEWVQVSKVIGYGSLIAGYRVMGIRFGYGLVDSIIWLQVIGSRL